VQKGSKGMTIEELKSFSANALNHAVKILTSTGNLGQIFHLIRRTGAHEVMGVSGETNSDAAKNGLAAMLRHRIAEYGDVEAVIMISDIFFAEITPEKAKIKELLGLNVEQAEAAGLCTKSEAIMVMLESPILQQMTIQMYERGHHGKVTLNGAPVITDNTTGGKFAGRFMQLLGGSMPSHDDSRTTGGNF
jgi:hypothetical protein